MAYGPRGIDGWLNHNWNIVYCIFIHFICNKYVLPIDKQSNIAQKSSSQQKIQRHYWYSFECWNENENVLCAEIKHSFRLMILIDHQMNIWIFFFFLPSIASYFAPLFARRNWNCKTQKHEKGHKVIVCFGLSILRAFDLKTNRRMKNELEVFMTLKIIAIRQSPNIVRRIFFCLCIKSQFGQCSWFA